MKRPIKVLKSLSTLICKPGSHPMWFAHYVKAFRSYVEYTNAHYLIRIPNETHLGGLYSKNDIEAHIVADVDNPSIAVDVKQYPNTEAIVSTDVNFNVTVDADYLMQILKVLKYNSEQKMVRLDFNTNDPGQPIKLANYHRDKSMAFLMPINADSLADTY